MDRKVISYVVKYIPALLLGLILIMPIFTSLFSWLFNQDKSTSFSYLNSNTLLLIAKSFWLSFIVAILATIIGTACSFIVYKFHIKGSGAYFLLLLLPLLLSPYILAVAWKDLWFVIFGNITSVHPEAGVILVHTLIYFPLAMVITGSSLININYNIEEAALIITSLRRMVFKILLPLIRPALTTSFLLIFIFSLSDFSVPVFFGVHTFTVEIFTEFSAFYNHDAAIVQSLLLTVICLGLVLVESSYLSDAPFFAVGAKGSAFKKYALIKVKYPVHLFLWIIIFISIFLPATVLVYQSFSQSKILMYEAWQILRPAIFQSVKLAFTGAVIITIVGFIAGYLQVRKKSSFTITLLLICFILPSTVFGIALINFYNQPNTTFIYASLLIILIGYIGKFSFISSRIIGNGFKQIPASLNEAALIMGVKPLSRIRKILLPLLAPSVLSAFMLAFVLCLGELGTTIMVYPPGTDLMPVKIFTISANSSQSLTSSMTLISFGITLFFIILFYGISKMISKKYQNV